MTPTHNTAVCDKTLIPHRSEELLAYRWQQHRAKEVQSAFKRNGAAFGRNPAAMNGPMARAIKCEKLANKDKARILEFLATNPGAQRGAICDALNLKKTRTFRLTQQMVEAGVIYNAAGASKAPRLHITKQ